MLPTLIISICTIIAFTLSVLLKPYIKIGKIKLGLYWIVSSFGAILLIVTNCISLDKVWNGITANTSVNPLKILALFISMTLISIFLGDSGFFDLTANKVFTIVKGERTKLFFALYFTVAILTIFTSNDIVILTFTPPICIFCKKAKFSPIPYLFAEFVSANTWSMMLVIGNPTNIYLASSVGITFFDYFIKMIVPTIFGGIVGLVALYLIFRHHLNKPLMINVNNMEKVVVDKPAMIVSLSVLGVCIIMLAISSFIGIEMYLICVVSFGVLLVFNLMYNLIKNKSAKTTLKCVLKAPFELIPFVLSMFIVVLTLDGKGITTAIGNALITDTKYDGISFGFLSSISANLFNNIPMSVLFEKIIAGKNMSAIYGTIIGSNIGAFITPVGALAGIMWNRILSDYNVKFSFKNFVLCGIKVALPTLIFALIPFLFLF